MCRPFPLARCVGIAICFVLFLVLPTEADRSEEVDQQQEAKESKALGNLSFHQETGMNISNAAELLPAGSRKAARQSAVAARAVEEAKDSKVAGNASFRHQDELNSRHALRLLKAGLKKTSKKSTVISGRSSRAARAHAQPAHMSLKVSGNVSFQQQGEQRSKHTLRLLAAGLNKTAQKSTVEAGAHTAFAMEGAAKPAHLSGKSNTTSKKASGKGTVAVRAHTRPAHVSQKSKAGLQKAARRSSLATGTHAAMASEGETKPALSGKAREIADQLDFLSGEMTRADEDAGKVREAVQLWANNAKSVVLSKGDDLASAVDEVAGKLETEHGEVAKQVTDAAKLGD